MAEERKPVAKKDLKALRTQQIQKLNKAVDDLTEKLRALREQEKRVRILQSVAFGLYEELDKLAKKAPADQVTDLVLEQTNDVIREAKELLPEDQYVQRYKEFVAAGDNPEHRDVVVVLRQIRQGLSRFTEGVETRRNRLDTVMEDAKGVRSAAQLYLEGESNLSRADLSEYEGTVMVQWFEDNFFNFERLDKINIETYYNV